MCPAQNSTQLNREERSGPLISGLELQGNGTSEEFEVTDQRIAPAQQSLRLCGGRSWKCRAADEAAGRTLTSEDVIRNRSSISAVITTEVKIPSLPQDEGRHARVSAVAGRSRQQCRQALRSQHAVGY